MNCIHCNALLIERARFCSQCGTPVPPKPSPSSLPAQVDERSERGAVAAFPPSPPLTPRFEVPVMPTALHVASAVESQQALPQTDPPMLSPITSPQPAWPPTQPMASPQPGPPTPPLSALPFYQAQGVKTRAVVTNAQEAPGTRNRRRGFLPGCLIPLIVVVILAGAGWMFALRPYLHSLAIAQLNQTMTNQIDQIPTLVSIPAGPFPVTDSEMDNLLAQNATASDTVQQLQAHFTAAGLSLNFQVYGLPATITGVPTVSQGQLLFSNVTVSGVVALILSPNDLTALFNQHLAAALARIHHKVKSVTLKNQEMDLVLA